MSHPSAGTTRDLCTSIVSRRFPNYVCNNDYELLTLAGWTRSEEFQDPAQIHNFLELMFKETAALYGSEDALRKYVEETLSCPVANVTGLKPSPTDNAVVRHRIPESRFSFRLWPQSIDRKEYCMDIVDDEDVPVNSDIALGDIVLSCDPIPGIVSHPIPVFSIERGFGIPQDKILPGEERFVLVEGYTCRLQRQGKKDFTFTVPTRL